MHSNLKDNADRSEYDRYSLIIHSTTGNQILEASTEN